MSKKEIPYESKPSVNWLDPVIGILFFFSLVAIGLAIALNFRPFYYWNIDWLDIEAASGLGADEIKLNYNALIDYCSPFFTGELKFPTLTASASGLSHFAEVKVIFNIIYITGLISTLIIIPVFIYKLYFKEYRFLRTCAITSVVVPILLLLACIINFDGIFILFHKVVFDNDDWLFSPTTDPVIKILPEEFFMGCAIIIASVVIIGAVTAFIIYLKKSDNKRPDDESSLIPRKKNYIY